jgi:hypothetical protein
VAVNLTSTLEAWVIFPATQEQKQGEKPVFSLFLLCALFIFIALSMKCFCHEKKPSVSVNFNTFRSSKNHSHKKMNEICLLNSKHEKSMMFRLLALIIDLK